MLETAIAFTIIAEEMFYPNLCRRMARTNFLITEIDSRRLYLSIRAAGDCNVIRSISRTMIDHAKSTLADHTWNPALELDGKLG